MAINSAERDRFDALLEQVLAELPQRIRALLDEAPLIVDDRPSRTLLEELGMNPDDVDDTLCGLHSGTPLTQRSVEHGHDLPETIHIFREGVIDQAGGWEPWMDDAGEQQRGGGVERERESGGGGSGGRGGGGGEERVREEIRITLLHEIGHHFGLDEEDLAELGYD